MMLKEMSIESVSVDKERMEKYKIFSIAFSYPDKNFFSVFKKLLSKKDREHLPSIYDRLFRAGEIWLYGAEHMSENEFQRANYLSDIMGFYKAFGVKPDLDRPDSLSIELEFMHYLIYKNIYALEKGVENREEKALLCHDAQKKFFSEHLYPAGKKVAEKILSSEKGFYKDMASRLLEFMEEEKLFLIL